VNTLHSHDVVHGDPRIDNVLMLDGLLKWVDFCESVLVTTMVNRRVDVQILLKSLGSSAENVVDEIEMYVTDPSFDKLYLVLVK
jgi:tRNA A-37 threonylcarbamoyl transferase component Bud32